VLGPSSEWSSFDGATIAHGDPGRWEKRPDGTATIDLSGEKNEGDWCLARLGEKPVGDAIVRCRAEPLGQCFGVQVQFGMKCQALVLRGQGTFVYNEVGGVRHDPNTSLTDQPLEIVLRREKGRASIWVDGKLVAEAAVDGAPATVAVGCVGGKARISHIMLRRLGD
jgi:hypothetical protein